MQARLEPTPLDAGKEVLAADPITYSFRTKAQKTNEIAKVQQSEGFATFNIDFEDLELGDFVASLVEDAPQPAMVMPLDLTNRSQPTGRKQAKLQTNFKVILVQVVALDPVGHPGQARLARHSAFV